MQDVMNSVLQVGQMTAWWGVPLGKVMELLTVNDLLLLSIISLLWHYIPSLITAMGVFPLIAYLSLENILSVEDM